MELTANQIENWRLVSENEECSEHIFAVSSWGCAGSKWLANVLNDCPGILCLHEATSYWRRLAGARNVSGVEYLRLLASLGSAATAAGDVNSVTRHELTDAERVFGERFRGMILVRDPLPRLRSVIAMFDGLLEARLWDVSYIEAKFPSAVSLLPTGSYAERLFVHGVNMLNAVLDEIGRSEIIRMEDVTTRPDALIQLVDYLTAGSVTPPETWASAAVVSSKVNRHTKAEFGFAPWQRRVIESVFDPAAISAYRSLGYTVEI